MDQGLLKRNPALTPAEFSHHWYHKHAPLVIPFFLHSGTQHYEQMHAPLSTNDPSLDLSAWDGVAGMPPQEVLDAPSKLPKWKQDYYREVILPDERRFLVSEALDHIYRVKPQTVTGERRVVIQEGKPLVEVGEEVWKIWREYERRGETEE
ncbi:hypothetical protein V492_06886 [Pseudogymnoascus sp. VKM F-4246]|nr:hypothetical protein V492_06886 [Pseudogymnoascus sp. VKM F-4246]